MMRRRIAVLLIAGLLTSVAVAADQPCLDIADEPSHQLVFENSNVRIFQLDLPRLKTTDVFCVGHPYIRIVVTEGRTSDLALGGPVSVGHDWKAGEARFIYEPTPKSVRNEHGTAFREYDIEMTKLFEYNPLEVNDSDLFLAGPTGLQRTETVSVARGSVVASSTVLAADDVLLVPEGDHFLMAITDVQLTASHQKVVVSATESTRLSSPAPLRLKNAGSAPARFILVNF
jgi:hypothetical protein